MFLVRRTSLGLGMAAICLFAQAATAAPNVPANFVVENATPGALFDTPTTLAFLPGGRMLVGEKRGRVYIVANGIKRSTPLLVLENEILNESDRGLLAIQVDPKYVTNHFIYLAYTVDPDSDGVDVETEAFARVTRYAVSFTDSNAVNPASRTILLGHNWRNGVGIGTPSHTIGDLQFGADGSLLVTTGDGADFGQDDAGGLYPNMFGATRTDPYEDIGAFRAQYIGSLDGKVLRINPANGHGYASNPYSDSNLASVQSRVWAYGLRNPYRFTMRPGTGSADTTAGNPGTAYIGDVGWNNWEELNVTATGGVNFGWPCYEGFPVKIGYQSQNPAHHGCGTMGTPANPGLYVEPLASWHHTQASTSTPPGFIGNAATCGAFYTKTLYPAQYRNQLFVADFGQSWIKIAQVNPSNQLIAIQSFGTNLDGPVCMRADPVSGDFYYVAIEAGEVRRIRYTLPTGNAPPVADAVATPPSGSAPLTVGFSSANSYDPDLDPLTFSWIFGDGQGSSQANPQHVYQSGGTYQAILTVDDGRGGIGRDTVIVVASSTAGFPSTGVLDNFNRANGAIGGAWVDQTNGLTINANALTQTCCYATTVWNGGGGVFGPDQEAYITFNQVTASAPEHDLMLKVQGLSYAAGHIEARYSAPQGQVQVSTHTAATGWIARGGPMPVTFAAGDQFGARAYSNGSIEVYKNGAVIGTTSAGDWPFAAQGGRLGMTLDGATSSRLDNFGGGNVAFVSNTPPTATILTPVGGAFFVNGDTISLSGTGSDAQQNSSGLAYDWNVTIHHNNHVHPSSYVATGSTASFVAATHDDGTGVHYEIFFHVTDSGGLADTASVEIFPEIDLTPSPIVTTPDTPGTTQSALYRFSIRNLGRMGSSPFQWSLRAGNQVLAEGDTLVAGSDSAQIVVEVQPVLAAGNYTLRATVDTLGTLYEMNEGNNAVSRPLTVVIGPGTVGVTPITSRTLALSMAFPNPSRASTRFTLDATRPSPLAFTIHDLQGRQIWSLRSNVGAGRTMLEWDGRTSAGRLAPAGVYVASVEVEGRRFLRRFALLH